MYYIYEIWDANKNEPIYVGYGKGSPNGTGCKRYEVHLKEAIAYKEGRIKDIRRFNMYKINVLNNCDNIEYRFPYVELSYDEVCQKEKEIISKYGRRIEKTGPLTNIDPGGCGGKERTDETKQKISAALTGKPSKIKGRKLAPYSESRVELAKRGKQASLFGPNGKQIRENISKAQQGKKISEQHKLSISATLKGRPSPMKGRTAWNKGLTKNDDSRIREASVKLSASKKGKASWNKGKSTPHKGKTYEEIYGAEKAKELRESKSNTAWITKNQINKKIRIDELQDYISDGWRRGRYVQKK